MKILSITSILSILLLFTFSQLAAQTSPISAGKMMLAGKLAFTSYGGDLYENEAKDKLTTISMNPSFGYFLLKGLKVGVMGQFDRISQGSYKESLLGIGPSLAYYLGDGNEAGKGHTYPYASVGFLYFTGATESEILSDEESETYKEDVSGTGLVFSLGFVHMLTHSIGFDTGLSYHMNSLKFEPKGEKGETLDGTTFNITFGIVAFF